jgi:hypothetical protein
METDDCRRESDGLDQRSETGSEASTSAGGRLASRRRFLKIGMASVPVIVTLAARPARATITTTGMDDYGMYGYGGAEGTGGGGVEDDRIDVTRPRPGSRRDRPPATE